QNKHTEYGKMCIFFLGEGSFGQVLKCSNFETGTMEAVKVMKSCTDVIEIAKHEIQILKQLRRLDPNTSHVVRFNSFFFNMEDICLSFEFLDVDLDTYISEMSPCKTGLPLPEVRHITEQLVTALHHLKTIGLIHMDMKPENVMIVDRHEKPLQVKLVDFGGAQMSGNIDFETLMFTKMYSSPEVLLESEMNEALDMWSLGVTAFKLAVGTDLFPYKEDFSCFDDVVGMLSVQQEHATGLDLFMDLIKNMLQVDPNQRITPVEALQHPFFNVKEEAASKKPCLENIKLTNYAVDQLEKPELVPPETVVSQENPAEVQPDNSGEDQLNDGFQTGDNTLNYTCFVNTLRTVGDKIKQDSTPINKIKLKVMCIGQESNPSRCGPDENSCNREQANQIEPS
uniref:Protein kinase domain-containing protein n=1 Tax=Takifugu rubripes TaxID=31033 RepID=H2SPS5_TAKRU